MAEGFAGYAVVEVMGHNRFVGWVTETTLAGAGVLKVEVPDVPGDDYRAGQAAYTKYIPPASLYAMTPISEDDFQEMCKPRPRYRLAAHDEDIPPDCDPSDECTGDEAPDQDAPAPGEDDL